MVHLSGFHVDDILYESEQIIVQHATHVQSSTSVVLKCAKRSCLTPVRRICFFKDYQVSKLIRAGCVVPPIDFFDTPEALIAVYPDQGCVSVNQVIRSRLFQSDEILRLFYLVASALEQIHLNKWVHMNLSQDHILTDENFSNVFIIDWQSAIKLDGYHVLRPPLVNDHLEMIPPERTGLTNDYVDERSDLYALGCIFYELFTHSPVFRESDPLRQIQSHIIRQPVPPHEGYDPYVPVTKHVPESISQILIKLLAKKTSQRYPSAYHLKCDLYKCLTDKSFISDSEPLKKAPYVIHMNRHLYERKDLIERIDVIYNSFSQQSFADGISTLLLISGHSGTGKTSLYKTLVPQVLENNGYWICDTFYATPDRLLGIFTRILSQLLTIMHSNFQSELENQIKQWTYKGLICPELLIELIPELTPLSNHLIASTRSQSQMIEAKPFLLALFQMLGQKFQPMVLCLENLQWADDESLMLLESILSDNRQSFFVISTCDTQNAQPIKTLIKNAQTQGVNVYSFETNPLSKTAVHEFLMDMFHFSVQQTEHLSEIIYEKTNGHPRKMCRLLEYLSVHKKCMTEMEPLSLDSIPDIWHPSLHGLNTSEIEIFQKISCIGRSWTMSFACQISGLSVLEMETIIQRGFQSGLIVPDMSFDSQYHTENKNDMWMFSDDRIRNILYLALSREKKEDVHQTISHQMSLSISKKSVHQYLYLVASHLDRTKRDNDLTCDHARLYLSAGERSLMSGLFLSAYQFFFKGISLFSETDWQNNHQLLFDLYLNAMIAANYASLDKESLLIAKQLSKNVFSNIEKLKYYECLASIYFRQNQHEKVLETVRQGLSVVKIQVSMPAVFRQWSIVSTGFKYRQFQKGDFKQKISDKNLEHRLTIRLMIFFIRSSYASDSKTATGVIAKAIRLMHQKNLTTDTSYLFIMFAKSLIDRQGFSSVAMHWAHMGHRIIDQLTDMDLQTEIRLIYIWNIAHRYTSYHHHLVQIKEELNRCLIRGYPERAVQAIEYYLFLSLSSGKRLKDILADLHDLRHQAMESFEINDPRAMYRQTIHNLISGIMPPDILVGQSFDEKKGIDLFTSNNDNDRLLTLYLIKLMLSVWFRNHSKAVLLAHQCESLKSFAQGTPMAQVVNFYVVLAYTGAYASAEKDEQKSWQNKIHHHLKQLKKWSDLCPENASHRYYLALAETANHLIIDGDIADYYDQAISFAKTHQFYHEAALANELAGAYYAKKEKEKLARSYIMDAYQAYVKWGADRKADEYARSEKILKPDDLQQTSVWPTTIKDTHSKQASSLSKVDNEDIWQVTQSFYVEIKLEVLLEKIIQTTLRYSGAHKGCLVLKKKQAWFVETHLNMETQEIGILISQPLESSPHICHPIAHKVIQSNEPVCLWDAGKQGEYQYDLYIRENSPRSLLCVPISFQDNLEGLLYLENKRLTGLFTTDRVKRIQIIASQAAIAIKNAQFFHTQEKTVQDRAMDLNLTVHQLSSAVQDLEARTREMMLLNQCSDALHGCHTDTASYLVLQSFAQKLFPGDLGILWIGDKTEMKIATSWGPAIPSSDSLEKMDCPCLQSKSLLFVEDVVSTPRCQSCGPVNDHVYVCIPLKDQSGEMGVLHFQFGTAPPRIFDDTFTRRLESRRLLICRMIEHYALALANLKLREALKYESRHDPLTGLFNRRHMQHLLKEAYKNAIQNKKYLGIVMVDIDHFKSFNDTYGHDTGDAVLKYLGAYLQEKTCSTLQPCRYGGEEFLLMCPNLCPDELFAAAESVRKGIMNEIKVPYEEKLLDVTASLGVAVFPDHGNDMTQVIQSADQALYKSKENGRNQVQMST